MAQSDEKLKGDEGTFQRVLKFKLPCTSLPFVYGQCVKLCFSSTHHPSPHTPPQSLAWHLGSPFLLAYLLLAFFYDTLDILSELRLLVSRHSSWCLYKEQSQLLIS